MKVEKIMINNRICLKPMKWMAFYDKLIKTYPNSGLPKPLILGAWNFSSDDEKKHRFRMHLDFAVKKGVSLEILKEVTEEDWYSNN